MASSVSGALYTYDLRKQRMVAKNEDEGSIKTSKLAISEKYLATGSESGIINIYQKGDLTAPRKSF